MLNDSNYKIGIQLDLKVYNSEVMEWFGCGVVETKTKSYITYEIDFLEILLKWKDKNER